MNLDSLIHSKLLELKEESLSTGKFEECPKCEEMLSITYPACPYCTPNPLSDRISLGKDNLIKDIKSGKIHIDEKDLFGKSFLSYEASNEGSKYLIRLLELGADPNSEDYDGRTPFFYAAEEDAKENMIILAKNGSNINVKSIHGKSIREWKAAERMRHISDITEEFIDKIEEIAENYKAGQIIKPAKKF